MLTDSGTVVSAVVAQYSAAAVELEQSIKTIFPLKAFLRRFSQHGHAELTPLHGHFFFLCLHAKCYSAAMEILDQCVRWSLVSRRSCILTHAMCVCQTAL